MRVGVKCPVDGERVSDRECLACRDGAPRAGRHCQYPREILLQLMDDSGRETAGVSATMLGGCRRQTWLQQREEWHVDPDKGWAALRGSIGHAILEAVPDPEALVEVRFEAELDGMRITGQIDKLHPGRKTITDFKTKAEDKKPVLRPQPDHVMQLNVYRWLAFNGWPQKIVSAAPFTHWVPGSPANIEVDALQLVYWTFGWVRTVEVPVLSDDEVESWIHAGLRAHASEAAPPVPADRDPLGRGRRPNPLCMEWCPVREHCLRHLIEEDEPPW